MIKLLVLGFAYWIFAIHLDYYKSHEGKTSTPSAARLATGVASGSKVSMPSAARLVTGVASVFLVLGLYFIGRGIIPGKDLQDFLIKNIDSLGDLGNTFLGIAITVFVLDTLNKRRQEEERKKEIFEEMESPVRDVAVEAIRLARKHKWLDEAVANIDFWMNAQLAGANLENVNLRGIILCSSDLQRANLRGVALQGADLQDVNLQEADLYEADLQGANLQGVNLQRTHLDFTSLQGTDLRGANLRSTNLQLTDLEHARYNHKTLWPEGFSPDAAGAVLVD